MRKPYVFLLFLFSGSLALGQPGGHYPNTDQLSRSSAYLGNTSQELVYDRAKIYLDDRTYDINGQQVLGSPFLYRNWNKGVVTTSDGRVFTNYQLKYNIFNQAIFFTNGHDSLETNDPIKQFFLLVPNDSGVAKQYNFIHSDQIKKEKSPFYYEIVVDSSQWQLLKVNRKVIAEPDNGLPVAAGKKVFQLEVTYFFYDKQTKRVAQLKANGTNAAKVLGLSPEEEKELGLRNVDFSNEASILSFFKSFAAKPKKGF